MGPVVSGPVPVVGPRNVSSGVSGLRPFRCSNHAEFTTSSYRVTFSASWFSFTSRRTLIPLATCPLIASRIKSGASSGSRYAGSSIGSVSA